MIPSAWVFVWLALGAFRLVRVIGWDDFPPILRLRGRATGESIVWDQALQDHVFAYRRPLLAKFVHCYWCQGFWVSAGVYVAWLEWPRPTLYALGPFVLSAAVGLTAKNLDP